MRCWHSMEFLGLLCDEVWLGTSIRHVHHMWGAAERAPMHCRCTVSGTTARPLGPHAVIPSIATHRDHGIVGGETVQATSDAAVALWASLLLLLQVEHTGLADCMAAWQRQRHPAVFIVFNAAYSTLPH